MTMAAARCSCDGPRLSRSEPPCPVHGTSGRHPLSNVIGGPGSGRPADSRRQSWRDAIKEAHEAVGAAEERRTEVLRAANAAGISTRQIAAVLGVSAATAWRWVADPADEKATLDAPAKL